MAKNTHAQEAATGTSDSYTEEELMDPNTPDPNRMLANRPTLGEVDKPSVGTNFSQSSESVETPRESVNPLRQSPAQMMGNPSPVGETVPSSVDSTDGDTRETETESTEAEIEEEADFSDVEPVEDKTPAKKSTPRKSTKARTSNAGGSDFDF
jgi:hypothetical protein